jgi:signal peptidase II
MGLILGGAVGNIIDRLVMGYVESYGGVFEGHVIDFIHFNLTVSGYPVFPYIFNVADMAISTAIIAMLIFHKRIVPSNLSSNKSASVEEKSSTDPDIQQAANS